MTDDALNVPMFPPVEVLREMAQQAEPDNTANVVAHYMNDVLLLAFVNRQTKVFTVSQIHWREAAKMGAQLVMMSYASLVKFGWDAEQAQNDAFDAFWDEAQRMAEEWQHLAEQEKSGEA